MTRVLNTSAPTWQRVGVLQRGKIFHFRPCLAVLSSRHIAHVKWVKLNVSFTVKLASALIICPSGNIFWVHSIDQRSRIIGLMLPATLTQCFLIKESQKREIECLNFLLRKGKKKKGTTKKHHQHLFLAFYAYITSRKRTEWFIAVSVK